MSWLTQLFRKSRWRSNNRRGDALKELLVECLERRDVFSTASSGFLSDGVTLAKAGGDLVNVYREYQSFLTTGNSPMRFISSQSQNLSIQGNTIEVEVRGEGDLGTLLSTLTQNAFQVTTAMSSPDLVDGYVSLDQLSDIASIDQVISIVPVYGTKTDSQRTDSQGTVSNMAEVSLHADLARTLFHTTGAGVTIGVMSDGASAVQVSASQASGNLPTSPQLTVLNAGSGNEGSAMMELIYDIAPGAKLRFYGGGGTDMSEATAINALVAAGCNIIVDDLNGFGAEPVFPRRSGCEAVDNAVASGVTYFSSAGNRGNSGYETPFHGVTTTVAGINGCWDNFDASGATTAATQSITLSPGQNTFYFQFDDPWYGGTGVTHNVNLFVLNSTSTTVLASGPDNTITTGQPQQVFTYTNSTSSPLQVNLAVESISGGNIGRFKYLTFNPITINNHLSENRAIQTAANPGRGRR